MVPVTTKQIWSWKIPSALEISGSSAPLIGAPRAPGPRMAGNISRDGWWAPERRCANTCTGNPRDPKVSKGIPKGVLSRNDSKIWMCWKMEHLREAIFKVETCSKYMSQLFALSILAEYLPIGWLCNQAWLGEQKSHSVTIFPQRIPVKPWCTYT